MKTTLTVAVLLLSANAYAELTDLVPEQVLKQIAEETSGEAAKRNLDTITLQHRMRASSQFSEATQHVVRMLESYGLDEVEVLEFPADGKTMFGTQKSRPVWDVRSAELWELAEVNGETVRTRRLGDWNSVPLSLAQDSLSGEATTTLVDIGSGTSDSDYAGKDIRGKLVLTSSQPEASLSVRLANWVPQELSPTRRISDQPGGRKTIDWFAGGTWTAFRQQRPSVS